MSASPRAASGVGRVATKPVEGDSSAPGVPLPSDAQPFPLSCACLNVHVEAYAANAVVAKYDGGADAGPGERIQVWLPEGAETIRHAPMSTYEKIGDEGWRKCWVCGTRMYSVKGKLADETLAPTHAWVDVDLSDGVLYGSKIDAVKDCERAIYSDLVLKVPLTSNFGRQPSSTTPVLYPPNPPAPVSYLPPIPDPFFLPPPFIPKHPALQSMCKAAVTALEARRAGIERDIASYITQRAHDVKRLEDQVRAEIEVLWDRYVQGPLGGKDVDRRGSISLTRPPPGTASAEPKATAAGDAAAKAHADEMEEIDLAFDRQWQKDALPSGVIPDPPSMSNSQFNSHTAVAASSLLSASLVTNAFYAPPPRPTAQRVVDIEELAKTTSRDNAAAREVAISYAFSNMALARGEGVPAEDEVDTPDVEEEEPEEREKGIDSWIAMERAQAVAAAAETPSNVENNIIIVNGANKAEDKDKDKSADAKKVVSDDKKPRGHVTFQEPAKPVRDKADAEDGNDDEGVDDDDDYVFDMEGDDIKQCDTEPVEQPVVVAPERRQVRQMVEHNLSRTFASDAPSHRAAWRSVAAGRVRSDENEDEDDAADYDMPDGSGLARSMPIHLVRPKRTGSANLEPKTSLTDRKGLLVPGLKSAMREPELAAPRVQASFVVGSINDVKARTPFPRLLSEARGNADKGKSKA